MHRTRNGSSFERAPGRGQRLRARTMNAARAIIGLCAIAVSACAVSADLYEIFKRGLANDASYAAARAAWQAGLR